MHFHHLMIAVLVVFSVDFKLANAQSIRFDESISKNGARALDIIINGDIKSGLTEQIKNGLLHYFEIPSYNSSQKERDIQIELDAKEPGRYQVMAPEQVSYYQLFSALHGQPSPESLIWINWPLHKAIVDNFDVVSIYIKSQGGSTLEATKLGRFIRANHIAVTAVDQCYSACVYILAAGKWRRVAGQVGIHRPYLEEKPTNQTPGEVIERFLSESRAYFNDMNISPSLADDMYSVGPANMKILTKKELDLYRLSQSDFAISEDVSVANANLLGLSRAEYEVMVNAVLSACGDVAGPELASCSQRVAKGLGLIK